MKKLIATFLFVAGAVTSASFAAAPCYRYCYIPEYVNCVRAGQPREVCKANYDACVEQNSGTPYCDF